MRYLIAFSGLLLLLASVAGIKVAQISTLIGAGRQAQKLGPPPEAVSTATAEEQTWEGTITAVATVAAAKGVAISNEAPGVVSRLHFESGATVRRGQLLVELDTDVERAQLRIDPRASEAGRAVARRVRACSWMPGRSRRRSSTPTNRPSEA